MEGGGLEVGRCGSGGGVVVGYGWLGALNLER